jgi:hypothetical protein
MALGKHLFSTRIFDLQRVLDYLKARPECRDLRVAIWGEGVREGLMAFYMAAIDPRLDLAISSHGLVTYGDVVEKNGVPDFDWYVPGILRYGDVPQIIGAIAPRRVMISAPVDIFGSVLTDSETRPHYAWAESVYAASRQAQQLTFVPQHRLIDSLVNWRGE